LVTGPASAGTINVLGSVDFGPGAVPFGTVNLGGDRGFTLNFTGQALSFHTAAANCSFPECPPGATINLNAFADPESPGHATLDGVSYQSVGAAVCPAFPCAGAFIQFTGQTVAPPFGDFTKAILKVPVEFSGTFGHNASGLDPSSEQLVASAIATLTLDKVDFESVLPQFDGPAWLYESIRYELTPTPEPTNLLLLGSSLAGIFVQGMWRRR
jgi:hypothetical protein